MRVLKKFSQERILPIPREEVWNILADTNHLNCVLGLFKVEYAGIFPSKSGVYRQTFTKIIGSYQLKWKEYPFQWNKGNYYNNLREYDNGPMKSFLTLVEVYDAVMDDGTLGTRLVLGAHVLSANWIGDLLIPPTVDKSIKKMFDFTLEYLRLKTEGKIHAVPQLKPTFEINTIELDRLFDELKRTDANLSFIPLFRDHILQQGDDEVTDMRPYHWADLWHFDREEILKFFLYCTKVGIFNLKWHLICPNCRVSKSTSDTLGDIADQYHCDFCGVNYETSLDKYMELCFSVHPIIRKAYKMVFCVGGPQITPHIYSQAFIRTGIPVDLTFPDGVENFRIRVLQANKSVAFIQNNEKTPMNGKNSLNYDTAGWSESEIYFTKDQHKITIHNHTENDIIVVFEKVDWDDIVVTAAKVSSMFEFRRMFSSEVLAPGHEVSIENLTILFSDLQGSTSFYENVGDAHAYGQVRKHFDFLEEWIYKNRGTIVKTIGDAVMAVFEKPVDGVKAALDIQTHISQFNNSMNREEDLDLVIKIGIHQGATIAVTSNNRIDFFGRNVNIAARVQGLSKGNDIILSDSCMESPQVVQLLEENNITPYKFEALLRGIEDKQSVYQIKFT
ncbi:adenylate/guanylate cyclase domain-containing protein [Paenibacillus psychroresistens]|uniref:Adenylate/guanylate cyclase domain-containing protein n=1 Tax=Paenibacillus psychroresistens TaxID=1778678 RepID=A0A6B8RLN1_9BACL|nr:adenylate/guanylate cyclase domain-containing protein [Paenibacillus psychroresistens]QGQ96929.1 adenylate/guanylate cyclase domain-containing protein [Paenibacillus psychroresistens]